MTTLTGTVRWVEPYYGPGELPVHTHCECTVEHAINWARNSLACRNVKETLSDEDALEYFITVHWAQWDADWRLRDEA